MKLRSILAATALTAVAATAAHAATEVSFWHAMGGQLGETTEKFAQDFSAQNDECTVTATYKGNYTENMTAAIAAFRAGEQPHIVQVFEVGTATMMSAGDKGAIYPVWKLMEDSGTEFDQSVYLPAVVSYYTDTDNKLLSLPFNSSTPVLFYNKTKLEELGLEVPKTWAELGEAAKKAKEAGVAAPLSFGWQSWTQIENYAAWHDIPLGTKDNGFGGLDTELKLTDERIVNHIQRIADWGKEGLFKYGGRRGDSRGMFVNGESIFWINSSAYYGGFVNDIKDWEFAQTMLPVDTDVRESPQNSIIGGATLWVLAGHEDAEYKCVAEFFKFLSLPEQQAAWHQGTGYVPITTAAYELSKEQGFYEKAPGTDTAIKQLSLNEPTVNSKGVRFGNFVQIRDIINEELEAVWSGDKDAATAMADAEKRSNELLRKFEKANQ